MPSSPPELAARLASPIVSPSSGPSAHAVASPTARAVAADTRLAETVNAIISRQASAEMLRILELRGRQTDPSLDFIGRRLRPRPRLAHLNGTLNHVRNDAGIIELQDQAFILVILIHDQSNEPGAEEAIARAAMDITALVQANAKTR